MRKLPSSVTGQSLTWNPQGKRKKNGQETFGGTKQDQVEKLIAYVQTQSGQTGISNSPLEMAIVRLGTFNKDNNHFRNAEGGKETT